MLDCRYFTFCIAAFCVATSGSFALAESRREPAKGLSSAEQKAFQEAQKLICQSYLDQDHAAFEVLRLRQEARARTRNAKALPQLHGKDSIKNFYSKAWPEFLRMANSWGVTPNRLYRYYFESLLDIEEALSSVYPYALRSQYVNGSEAISQLSRLDPNHKLRPADWQLVLKVHNYFAGLAITAIRIEELSGVQKPSFDCTASITSAESLRAIFASLDESLSDRGDHLVYKILDTREKMNHSARPQSEDEQNEIEKARANHEQEESVALPEVAPTSYPNFVQLGDFLRNSRSLDENLRYFASIRNPFLPSEIEIRVSSDLAKVSLRQWPSIKKLLSSIFLGLGGKSGIKKLYELSPGLIEIKTIMRGHKRILGCLRGNVLYLKEFDELPESVASYARRIPSNYCTKLTAKLLDQSESQ